MQTIFDHNGIHVKDIDACYLCGSDGSVLFDGLEDRLFSVPGRWKYKTCNACGLNWLTPRPADLSQSYQTYYTHSKSEDSAASLRTVIRSVKRCFVASAFGYHDMLNNKRERIFGRGLSWIGPLREISGRSVMWLRGEQRGRLLDVGCGDGSFLANMHTLGWKVTGVEPDSDAARNARGQRGLHDIYTGLLEDTQLEENSFDVITMGHVLEHLPDPVQTLRQCWLLLRSGGQMVITTPNSQSLGRKRFKQNWRGWEPPRHLFLFDSQTIGECAQKAGFRTRRIQTHATTAFDTCLSSCMLSEMVTSPGVTSQRLSKIRILQALGFWLLEYFLNCTRPCGEELVMSVRKT